MSEMPPELIPKKGRAETENIDSGAGDHLTGLPNRASFESALNKLIEERNDSKALLVMFLDLNEFKQLNDTRGHPAGDLALRVVGDVLKSEPGIPCRNGGDEFAYAEEFSGHSFVSVERVRTRINEALIRAGFGEVSVSIGCAVSEQGDKRSREDLLKEADVEMYADKRRQRAKKPVTTETLKKGLYPRGSSSNN